jgi:hypothetical protein
MEENNGCFDVFVFIIIHCLLYGFFKEFTPLFELAWYWIIPIHTMTMFGALALVHYIGRLIFERW